MMKFYRIKIFYDPKWVEIISQIEQCIKDNLCIFLGLDVIVQSEMWIIHDTPTEFNNSGDVRNEMIRIYKECKQKWMYDNDCTVVLRESLGKNCMGIATKRAFGRCNCFCSVQYMDNELDSDYMCPILQRNIWVVMHELGHTLGMSHIQSRHNEDCGFMQKFINRKIANIPLFYHDKSISQAKEHLIGQEII